MNDVFECRVGRVGGDVRSGVRPFGVETETARETSRGLGSGHGIERQSGLLGKAFARPFKAWRMGGNELHDSFGKSQSGRADSLQQGLQSAPLLGRWNDLSDGLAIATQSVVVVNAAQHFRSSFSLIAVQEI